MRELSRCRSAMWIVQRTLEFDVPCCLSRGSRASCHLRNHHNSIEVTCGPSRHTIHWRYSVCTGNSTLQLSSDPNLGHSIRPASPTSLRWSAFQLARNRRCRATSNRSPNDHQRGRQPILRLTSGALPFKKLNPSPFVHCSTANAPPLGLTLIQVPGDAQHMADVCALLRHKQAPESEFRAAVADFVS